MKLFSAMIIRLLLLFYLTSAFLSATHIHNDELEHNDCKICIIAKNINSADAPSLATFTQEHFDLFDFMTSHEILFSYEILKGFNANAPPLF